MEHDQNGRKPARQRAFDIDSEVIAALRNHPLDPEQVLKNIKNENAELATWLYAQAENARDITTEDRPQTAGEKRAFMLGVAAALGAVGFAEVYRTQLKPLEELFREAPYTDERHTPPTN